jgi:hypothetical protein
MILVTLKPEVALQQTVPALAMVQAALIPAATNATDNLVNP